MRALLCFLLGSLVLLCLGVNAITYPLPQNGWYSCNLDTFSNPLLKHSKTLSAEAKLLRHAFGSGKSILSNLARPLGGMSDFNSTSGYYDIFTKIKPQCAQFTLPLCHSTICNSNENIDVFVKRILADKQDPKPKALWLLQGGPGASSSGAMETIMESIFRALKGTVDVYTMDHRGTGRSHHLGCTAAQVETSGSPTYGEITPEVLPACIQDLNTQLGGSSNASILSAFSTTSAALDLSTLITNTNNSNTYVYGVSYGTYLVERLMQLNNTNIKGYILDGVASQSGSQDNKKLVFNDWDTQLNTVGTHLNSAAMAQNTEIVAERFVSLCSSDERCSVKFQSLDLKSSILKMYASFSGTTYANSTRCQISVRGYGGNFDQDPVPKLQHLFAYMLQQQELRGMIPILVYRFLRCSDDDNLALSNFFIQLEAVLNVPDESDNFNSNMLYLLIVSSELWRFPSEPPAASSQNLLFSSGISDLYSMVCVTSASDPSCATLVKASNGSLWQYPRDQYYDKPITIPAQSSVLMLSGLLDPQTVAKFARYQYESFIGTAKRLFEFNNSAHGTVLYSPDAGYEGTCAIVLIASYIQQDGNVSRIDTTCTSNPGKAYYSEPKLESVMFGLDLTADRYEGTPKGHFRPPLGLATFEERLSNDGTTNYFTAMVIGYVLAGILFVITLVLYCLLRRRQKNTLPTESPAVTPVP